VSLGFSSLLELLLHGMAVTTLLLMGLAVLVLTESFQVDLLLSVASGLDDLSLAGSFLTLELERPE
jgi:hypothetical protein